MNSGRCIFFKLLKKRKEEILMKRRGAGRGFGGPAKKKGKKENKLTPEEQAVRDEFCAISSEVYAFGKNGGNTAIKKDIYQFMPNADIDKDKQKKRVVLPYKLYQKSVKKRKLLEEKLKAEAPPAMDDPLAAIMRKNSKDKKRKRGGNSMADFIRQQAGNRSGMRGLGDGSRGLNATGVGHFKDGFLHVSQKEIEARSGNRGGPRRLGALTKGKSKAPIGNRATGWMRKGRSKKH